MAVEGVGWGVDWLEIGGSGTGVARRNECSSFVGQTEYFEAPSRWRGLGDCVGEMVKRRGRDVGGY